MPHGHDQVSGNREEDRPPRRLRPRQRGNGLPGRRGLGQRKEHPLPDAEEHLASVEVRPTINIASAIGASWLALGGAAPAQERLAIGTTTSDLRRPAEAGGGARACRPW